MDRIRRNLLTGLLTIVPLWITVWVIWFVLDLLVRTGRPLAVAVARSLRPESEALADLILSDVVQSILALLIVLLLLYLLGAAAQAVIGRRILRLFDQVIERLPIAKTIYGATRTLIESVRIGTPNGQRVVLIEFPMHDMRAVGFVTATFRAADTGEELAAVYVPTTPNPTSGYVEIVPVSRIVWLDWSTSDAMQFIVSGGALTRGEVRMHPDGAPKSQ